MSYGFTVRHVGGLGLDSFAGPATAVAATLRVWGLRFGFGVWGLGFGVGGLGLGVWCLGLGVGVKVESETSQSRRGTSVKL